MTKIMPSPLGSCPLTCKPPDQSPCVLIPLMERYTAREASSSCYHGELGLNNKVFLLLLSLFSFNFSYCADTTFTASHCWVFSFPVTPVLTLLIAGYPLTAFIKWHLSSFWACARVFARRQHQLLYSV